MSLILYLISRAEPERRLCRYCCCRLAGADKVIWPVEKSVEHGQETGDMPPCAFGTTTFFPLSRFHFPDLPQTGPSQSERKIIEKSYFFCRRHFGFDVCFCPSTEHPELGAGNQDLAARPLPSSFLPSAHTRPNPTHNTLLARSRTCRLCNELLMWKLL